MGLILVLLLRPFSPILYISVLFFILGLGWYCAGRMEQASGKKDSPEIVIDEIAGMLVAAFMIPSGGLFLVASFFLFRLLDIIKPFPARWIERDIPGGGGIMLDDVMAGIYTNLILQGIRGLV